MINPTRRHFGLTLISFVFVIAGVPALSAGHSSRAACRAAIETAHEARRALVQKDPKQAEYILTRFLRDHPDCKAAVVYQLLGNSLVVQKRWREAHQAYQRALSLQPGSPQVVINLAEVCFRQGKFHQARDLYRRGYRLGGRKNPDLIYRAAICAFEGDEFDMVEKLLAPITTDPAPNPPEWWELRIKALVKHDGKRRAEALLTRLLGARPMRPGDWKLLARLRLERGQQRPAAIALEIADQITPLNPKERRSLAAIYLHLGLPLPAAAQLERVYGPRPAPDQCDQLASLFARAGDNTRARHYLELALAREPTATRYLRQGQLLYLAARYEEAVKALEEAVRLAPEDNDSQWLLGIYAWEAGDMATAGAALKRVRQDPSYGPRATALLDTLKYD